MGQHKVSGASLGARGVDYKELQRAKGSAWVLHDDHRPDTFFSTRDGREYRVERDGSFRRVELQEK